jgi:hypothetical protein
MVVAFTPSGRFMHTGRSLCQRMDFAFQSLIEEWVHTGTASHCAGVFEWNVLEFDRGVLSGHAMLPFLL